KRTLHDRTLKALKAAKPGQRYEIMDKVVPGFGVRVTEQGQSTFMWVAKYPRSPNPTRRALGEYGELTLDGARTKARTWLDLLRGGVDPKDEQGRHSRAEQRKRPNSFAAVAEEFVSYIHRQKLRTAPEMERNLRRVFISRWASRPIT